MKKYILGLITNFFTLTTFTTLIGYDSLISQNDQYFYPDVCEDCDALFPPNKTLPNTLSITPEYYYVNRTRKGGTKQTGNAGGIRVSYDYIKRYCFYVGGQAFFGSGILTGHTGARDKIKSRLTDTQVEGYLGYTFQMKCYPFINFTPYGGYGYWRETNKFISPSPLRVKYQTTFGYFAFGFLSKAYVNERLSFGLNARFRLPYEPRAKISNDPDFENIHQHIGNCFQYRLELPMTYNFQYFCRFFEIGITPFYEMRKYGARENFPFDFHRTIFNIYGANIQFTYRF